MQGYTVTDQALLDALSLTDTETAVWIPAALADEARETGYTVPVARAAADGGLIVRGTTVTDPELLADLHLPPRESAVFPEHQEALL